MIAVYIAVTNVRADSAVTGPGLEKVVRLALERSVLVLPSVSTFQLLRFTVLFAKVVRTTHDVRGFMFFPLLEKLKSQTVSFHSYEDFLITITLIKAICASLLHLADKTNESGVVDAWNIIL